MDAIAPEGNTERMTSRSLLIPSATVIILTGCAANTTISQQSTQSSVSSASSLSSLSSGSLSSSPSSLAALPCSGQRIPDQTEGPYYKSGSPERKDIREANTPGTPLFLTGRVLDEHCQPIANAWLDFWQADGTGAYDNQGYALRGHQFTNDNGEYRLTTVIPSEYPGRAPHIHVKVRVGESYNVITSQLYWPDRAANQDDGIFREETVVKITGSDDRGTSATYDIVVPRD